MAKAYAYLMGSIHHVKRKNCYSKFDKLMDTYNSISLFIFVIQKSDTYALIWFSRILHNLKKIEH